jgi:hypothetical protein
MRFTLTTLLALLAAAPLAAQDGFSLVTASRYGVLARAADRQDSDAVAARTPIERPLHLHARLGDDRLAPGATTLVRREALRDLGVGVTVAEEGHAHAPQAGVVVGTSGDGDRPSFGSHALRLGLRVAAGTKGKVVVLWHGNASDGAFAGALVDVDGDGTADFAGRADGQPHRQAFDVTAGRDGLVIAITTIGQAAARAGERAAYAARLGVFFHPAGSGGVDCEVTPFGRPCGGALAGRAGADDRGIHIGLHVTGAAPNVNGVVLLGTPLDQPRSLPGSDCLLLVDGIRAVHFTTDRAGAAQLALHLPGARLHAALQALTVERTRDGVRVASTNGLTVVCR